MNDRREESLEDALVSLRGQIAFPPTPDLATRVVAGLHDAARDDARRGSPERRRRGALAIAAALILIAALIAAIPATRSAVAGLFGIGGVRLSYGAPPQPPGALGTNLDLGARTTLEGARREVGYPVTIPTALGNPDAVFVSRSIPGGKVSLAYRAGTGLPKAPETGWGALVTEFKAPIDTRYIKKMTSANQIHPALVHGAPAYWIQGRHVVYLFRAPDGRPQSDTIRFAPNSLLWQRLDVTIRLESELGLKRAEDVATSMP